MRRSPIPGNEIKSEESQENERIPGSRGHRPPSLTHIQQRQRTSTHRR